MLLCGYCNVISKVDCLLLILIKCAFRFHLFYACPGRRYVTIDSLYEVELNQLMEQLIRKKLAIIPRNVTFGGKLT